MSETDLILAVDIGTSECKAVLVNATTGLIDSKRMRYEDGLKYPHPGWVEQIPTQLSNAIFSTTFDLINSHENLKKNIRGLTFTSQMQCVLPLDDNGKPVNDMNMLSWMDARAVDITRNIMFKGWPRIQGYPAGKLLKFLSITGGIPGLSGKDTISKIVWFKHEQPEIYKKTYKFVDIKDYAVYLATGRFVTSVDVAYITWLMDTRNGINQWSEKLCNMYNLDINKLCEILPSTANVGTIIDSFAERTGLNPGIPVINGAGDLLTSAIGSGAIEIGSLHSNIGTAGWVGCHFPEKTKDIANYVGTIASGIPNLYLILSKQETLGGAFDWLKEILFPAEASRDTSDEDLYKKIDSGIKNSPPGAKNLIFTPWLSGERSPLNDANLRGQIFNIGMDHNRDDLFRAVCEGVAFNLLWGMEVVEKLSKKYQKPGDSRNEIIVMGGASKSDAWCQIFADIWQKKVRRIKNPQMASAIGAACIAMVSLGIFKDFSDIKQLVNFEKEFIPNSENKQIYNKIYTQYRKLYKNNIKMFRNLNGE